MSRHENSEFALADKFAAEYGDQFGFLWEWKRWYVWASKGSSVWELDIEGRVYDRIRAVCEAEGKRCEDSTLARSLASWHSVKGVDRLARLSMRLKPEDRRPLQLDGPPEYVSGVSGPPSTDQGLK